MPAPVPEENFRLLVVDDDAGNRDVLTRRLQRNGFEVVAAESGPDALLLIMAEDFDLVILDWLMPEVSGLDVLSEVRRTRSPTDLPIIMATAITGSDAAVEALELGANDYVTKPLDFPLLLARIRAHLRTRTPRIAAPAPAPEPPPPAPAPVRTSGAETKALGPGLVLDGRYRLDAGLGDGGYGSVFRATHVALDKPVAVKVLHATRAEKSTDLERFRREGVAACRLDHPGAVSVLDFGITADGLAYLVMEMLEGESVMEELLRKRSLTATRCAQIAIPVCDVLASAHAAGVVHRDVKPSNIFLQRTARGEVVKVLDFGIARIAGQDMDLTLRGRMVGTTAYSSPERLMGKPYDGKADVYSLGVTLYQMLEGRLPFFKAGEPMTMASMHIKEAPPPLRVPSPAVRAVVEPVIMAALRKDPKDRPSAQELAVMCEQTIANLRRVSGERG